MSAGRLACAITLAGTLAIAPDVVAQERGFGLVFQDAQSEAGARVKSYLDQDEALYELVNDVNAAILLQGAVPIVFAPGAAHEVVFHQGRINVSYGFVDDLWDLFIENDDYNPDDPDDFGMKIMPVVDETVVHEMAHAFIQLNSIPMYQGENEEVMANELAFLILSRYDTPEDIIPVVNHYFYRDRRYGGQPPPPSEHPSDVDRALDYICWMYGYDPDKFADAASMFLEQRAAGCAAEFQQIDARWTERLGPFLRGCAG